MKKAISARIDEDTLRYFKSNGIKVNTLINELLKGWMTKNQERQLLAFQEETGQDELSRMKANNNIKCSQCCNNCKYISNEKRNCYKTGIIFKPGDHINIKTFACIYWDKKKGSN